ncbi:MAG: ABC transporter permease [Actinomycetota bacterium]|nr:ABC transporter permease [Actinomycetota bacterium]
MRTAAAAFRLQLRIIRSDPDYVMPLVTVPMFTLIFLAIVQHAGREDLTGYAVMAPVLIALWALSIYVSGEIVSTDRSYGVLESLVASPAPFPVVIGSRVLAVTTVALAAFVEAWLVARLAFGITVEIHHPLVFGSALGATVVATSGAGVIMAGLFVVGRSVRNFQNALTYPFYVLGGVLVPVTVLPDWIEPASRIVFLSWSADLLRDALAQPPIGNTPGRLAVILALGAANFAIGYVVLQRMLRRVRATGTLGFA